MKTAQALSSRYALILDPAEIRKVLRKVEALNLPRRECHPLDRYKGKKVSADLARYDAAVDRGFVDEEPVHIEEHLESPRSRACVEEDDDLDEWDS